MSDEFSKKIKDLRISRGLTLQEVGDIVGVGKSTVRKWENGMIENMRRDKIAKLATALGVTPGFLMGWDEDPIQEVEYVACISRPLTPDEASLLADYQKLNDVGKGKAREYISDLTEQKKYTEDTESLAEANIA